MAEQSDDVHLRMLLPEAPWTRAMADGSVHADGVSWECVIDAATAPQRFSAASSGGYDVGESGVRSLVLDHLRGGPPRALPAFLGREHMQRNVIVRKDSPLKSLSDLAGKRVGSRQPITSGTSSGVLLMLEHGYGVTPDQVQWFVREDPESMTENRMHLDLQPGPTSTQAGFEQLRAGELDAVLVGGGPRYWSMFGPDGVDREIAGQDDLRPLVMDPGTIAETYRRTGLYPITDLVVLQPDMVQRYPWLPKRVTEALSQANRRASSYRDEAEEALAKREIELLGEDPHQYWLGASARRSLALLIELFYRIGAIERAPVPEELFIPSAL